jgi:hypothetical protein
MEARVPLRNLNSQYPSGSLTPSRPAVNKSKSILLRRAHSAGKLRKEQAPHHHHHHHPESHISSQNTADFYDTYSPLSVSEFCPSPSSVKKRPSFGRTVVVSRSSTKGFTIHPNKPVSHQEAVIHEETKKIEKVKFHVLCIL